MLCWAVEEASIDDIPNALRNWEALAPEERWWLYTMTVATTGQAMKKGVGWRKALRAAIADNPRESPSCVTPGARSPCATSDIPPSVTKALILRRRRNIRDTARCCPWRHNRISLPVCGNLHRVSLSDSRYADNELCSASVGE